MNSNRRLWVGLGILLAVSSLCWLVAFLPWVLRSAWIYPPSRSNARGRVVRGPPVTSPRSPSISPS